MAERKGTLPTWARVLAIIVGAFSIAAACIVLLFPGIAVLTLVLLLGIALFFIGIDRLVAGVTGHPHAEMVVVPIRPAGPADIPPGPPGSPP
jgi:hypothetical protein